MRSTAAAVFVGVRYVMGLLYPVSDLALLGLYLPLLVADPIVLKRYERPQRERCAHGAAQRASSPRWAIS